MSNPSNFSCFRTEWLLDCLSIIAYERKIDNQVFYVFPVEYMLGKLPVVPLGDTATIPCSMWQHAEPGGRRSVDCACETSKQGCKACSRSQGE